MTLSELKTILEAAGFPVAYSHFTETDNEPLPQLPFIVYVATFSSHFLADNKVFKSVENIQVELYTERKDEAAEAKVETVLNDNEIPFATTETFIDSEQMYQKIYEVRLF
jgi:hypothetical protein